MFASHIELLLNSPVVEPGLGILMPPALEVKVRVLTTVRRNFREPFGFHIVKILLVDQISKHSILSMGDKPPSIKTIGLGVLPLILRW